MIRPIHESDHTVSPDGTLSLRDLRPGERVHVVVVPLSRMETDWGSGPIKDSRVFAPEQPRLPWGALEAEALGFEEPFAPACDAGESDSVSP